MKRAAVIPHDQIACPPMVLINKARLGRKRHQLVEKSPALRLWPTDDVGCMGGKMKAIRPSTRSMVAMPAIPASDCRIIPIICITSIMGILFDVIGVDCSEGKPMPRAKLSRENLVLPKSKSSGFTVTKTVVRRRPRVR